MSKKNVGGRSTSRHDKKKFRTRSMEKQRGMAFGFRKTATAVIKPGQIDRSTYYILCVSWIDRLAIGFGASKP